MQRSFARVVILGAWRVPCRCRNAGSTGGCSPSDRCCDADGGVLQPSERRAAAVNAGRPQTGIDAATGTQFILPVTSSPFGPSWVYARNFFLRRYLYAIAHQESSHALS